MGETDVLSHYVRMIYVYHQEYVGNENKLTKMAVRLLQAVMKDVGNHYAKMESEGNDEE